MNSSTHHHRHHHRYRIFHCSAFGAGETEVLLVRVTLKNALIVFQISAATHPLVKTAVSLVAPITPAPTTPARLGKGDLADIHVGGAYDSAGVRVGRGNTSNRKEESEGGFDQIHDGLF